MFNACIDTLNLREVELSGRKFTWVNRLQNQTFERLDRVLFCTDLESKFPQTTLHALTREILDHTPLLLNTNNSSSSYQPQFKFELGWLTREGFCDLVHEVWDSIVANGSPLKRWQAKIRRLRQYLRGWAKNISGNYKKEK